MWSHNVGSVSGVWIAAVRAALCPTKEWICHVDIIIIPVLRAENGYHNQILCPLDIDGTNLLSGPAYGEGKR